MEQDDTIYFEVNYRENLWHCVNAITGEILCVSSTKKWVILQALERVSGIPCHFRVQDEDGNLDQELIVRIY